MKSILGGLVVTSVSVALLSGCGGGGIDQSAASACDIANAGYGASPGEAEDLVEAAMQSDNADFRDLALDMDIKMIEANATVANDMNDVVSNYYGRFVSLCQDSGYE